MCFTCIPLPIITLKRLERYGGKAAAERAEREADFTDRLALTDAERGALAAAERVARGDDSAREERDRLLFRAGSTKQNTGDLTEEERQRVAAAEVEADEQSAPYTDAYKASSGPKLQALAVVAASKGESVSGLKKRHRKRSASRCGPSGPPASA